MSLRNVHKSFFTTLLPINPGVLILKVRPGITAVWQVSTGGRMSIESYLTLNVSYVENWSLLLDLKIPQTLAVPVMAVKSL